MDRFNLFIPMEPVAKGRPRMTSQGRPYTPAKTAAYEKALKLFLKRGAGERPPITGSLTCRISFVISRPKSVPFKKRANPTVKPDLDNLAKAVLDAANGILWEDDAQICQLTVEKSYTWEAGRPGSILLEVSEMVR